MPIMIRLATALDEPSPRGLDDLGGRWDSEIMDAIRQQWLLDLLPGHQHTLPSTHQQRGSGASFAFERRSLRFES